jgi:hypothetical protein
VWLKGIAYGGGDELPKLPLERAQGLIESGCAGVERRRRPTGYEGYRRSSTGLRALRAVDGHRVVPVGRRRRTGGGLQGATHGDWSDRQVDGDAGEADIRNRLAHRRERVHRQTEQPERDPRLGQIGEPRVPLHLRTLATHASAETRRDVEGARTEARQHQRDG